MVEDSKRTGLRVLGILRDADEEPAARVQSTIDAIERAGLPAASQAGIFTDTEPSTGFFLLPDHERPGSIETLCKEAVLDEPEAECVSAYLDCVERRRGSNWSTANRRDKAFVYSYMAALVRPTDDTEVAAWRDAWDLTASVFQPLRLFLDRLTDLADP
ncbi:MAG: hypothetical protein F4210_17420 [Holophagales bacterium]|nr:hypothetical protein [Holophagales bacterium]